MINKKNFKKTFFAVLVVAALTLGMLVPLVNAKDIDRIDGFDKGPSYTSVVPMKKVTFVNFDENTFLDDYAYLAAIPTSVFKSNNQLYSNPLLFYQDSIPIADKYDKTKSLNARVGVDYFMEDWMSYCNGQMDTMTVINVPKEKVNQWNAKEYKIISADNPYEIASSLALQEWAYSDDVVLAVIQENFVESLYELSNSIKGKIESKDMKTERFEVKQTNRVDPVFHTFNVPEGYKYMKARTWYESFYMTIDLGGFFQLANMTIPAGEKDFQLYCKEPSYDDYWMQTSAIASWNQKFGMDTDIKETYIYNIGEWKISITDIPTKGAVGRYGTWGEILKNMLTTINYKVDVELYPGSVIPLTDTPPFGCRDISINLKWNDPNVNLGFSLIGPAGEEILTEFNESRKTYQEMHLDQLGECLEGENYSVCVYSRGGLSRDIDFEVEYSWKQGISDEQGNSLTSATEAAVLASQLNAPLLYIKQNSIPQTTKDVLYKLGVKNVYLVDIGGELQNNVKDEINSISKIKKDYITLKDFYDDLRKESGNNDVIFATLNSWHYWYAAEMKPAGQYPAAMFLGPAAYIAAHHGSPVILIDNHPRLSSAVVWHNEFWKRIAKDPVNNDPSVAEMHLTGKRVYEFLREYGFDEVGLETIISVGGQYEIGPSWDRMFLGMATAGKFFFSPVDTAYWISRNVFYPALVFENPGMNPQGVKLTTGSSSERRSFLPYGKFGLKITEEEHEKIFKYPVHLTFVSYQHRYNERGAIKYYGYKYECADGTIPGETVSFDSIDQDSIKKYTGKEGSFMPDMSLTDIMPFYLEKGGFECAYGSSFPETVDNVNKGVLYWHLGSHGGHGDTGTFLFWDSAQHGASVGCGGLSLPPGAGAKKESNPWRAYDWYLGSTDEPDTLTVEVHGIIPALLGNPQANGLFRTAFDWAPAKKPILDKIGNVLSVIPIVNRLAPSWLLDTQDYYDGMVCSIMLSTMGFTWYNGWTLDEALENLHSTVFTTGVCLSGTKYLHTSIVRHGSVAQVIDPWGTSWYGCVWMQSIPRDMILGYTIGEAYNRGISKVGIIHIGEVVDGPRFWWDNYQNVVYYGDPDLRMFVPSTEYSDNNYWTREETRPIRYDNELSIDGHMPFGATSYPNQCKPFTFFEENMLFIIVICLIIILAIYMLMSSKKRKKNKKK
jgi:hypothetical protein